MTFIYGAQRGAGKTYAQHEEVKQAFAGWVESLAEWDWWVTLTLRDKDPSPDQPYWTKPGFSYAGRAWEAFLDKVRSEQVGTVNWGDALQYVSAWELQRERGVPHIHAVVAGCGAVYRLGVKEWWWDRYGIARILPFDKARGAAYYVSKYIAKGGMVHLDAVVTNRGAKSNGV